MLSDDELLRYSRQLMLEEFDIAGQERLKASSVLVAGLGGLGSPAAIYLASAGVGRLVLADGDAVELSNLQRQPAHGETNLGMNKAQSAAATLRSINSTITVDVITQDLAEEGLGKLLDGVDLVVDATDNYPVRFALNRACIAHRIPMVSAAAVRSEGQLAVFHPTLGGPCYRCLYPEAGQATALNCRDSGVLAPVVGVLGSLQAMEAVKVLSGFGEPLYEGLLVMDLRTLSVQRLALGPRSDCPDCSRIRRNCS